MGAGYTAPVTSLENAVFDYVRKYLLLDKLSGPVGDVRFKLRRGLRTRGLILAELGGKSFELTIEIFPMVNSESLDKSFIFLVNYIRNRHIHSKW